MNRTNPNPCPRPLAVALALSASLLPLAAGANLRAPRVIPESPSSALSAPDAPLTVERELLRFVCGADSCLVSAQYEVTAAAPARVQLDFILPVRSDITATTNGDEHTVQVAPATPLRPEEARALPDRERGAPPLFRAGFESALREGQNTVTIRYSHPLGAEEADYGYGKEGRMVQRFRYELWPLREWRQGPKFEVKLEVAIERPAPGWWTRWFGTSRSISCLTSDPKAPTLSSRLEQRGAQLWYLAGLGASVPDRLTCFLGDEDLMPRY